MRGVAIATAVLFVNTSAYAAPMTLVCNGKVSIIRWEGEGASRHSVIEDSSEGDQWTVTIETATKKLTLYWHGGDQGFVGLEAEGDIKPISMQASIDALKGTKWEGAMPYDGSINRITGAFVVTIPSASGLIPNGGFEYSGICKQAQPLF
jgi:hypothetical protein